MAILLMPPGGPGRPDGATPPDAGSNGSGHAAAADVEEAAVVDIDATLIEVYGSVSPFRVTFL